MPILTDAQIHEIGRKARAGIRAFPAEFADWAVFSRSLGWFKWKRKLALTDAQVEVFRKGFCGEALRIEPGEAKPNL
jgi:hypothetical protein